MPGLSGGRLLALALTGLAVSGGSTDCLGTPAGRIDPAAQLAAPGEILQLALAALICLSIYLWQRRRLAEQHARDLGQLNETIQRSQEALQQSEERFRRAFEDGPVGILLSSPESRLLRANRAFCQLLGYEEKEILGLGLMDLAHPEDAAKHYDKSRRLFRREPTSLEQELRFVTRQKEILWARVTTSILSGTQGEPLYELSLFEDITARRRSEQALHQLEERFSKAFHLNPVPIALSTLHEGRFIDVNDSFVELTGYARTELLGRTSLDLNLWEDRAARDRVLAQLHEQGSVRNVEGRFRNRRGESRLCLAAFESFELNGQTCLLAILHDITERKQAEEGLRRSEERFQLIARATNDTVWDWDLAANRIWWNEGIKTVFGYTADQVSTDANWWDQHIHPEDRARVVDGMRQVIESGTRFWSAEYRYRRADGSYAEVFDRAFVLQDDQGRPVRMLGAILDITERNRFLNELATARDAAVEALRIKSEFLANISHEVRTPLNGIVGMTVLLQDSELTVDQRSYVDAIQSCTDHLLTIINDILDFSKMEAGKLHFEALNFDLRNTVESTIEILADRAQDKHVELVCLIDADVPGGLRGDPGRLRQVITNLVVNAIKFTERGEVVVGVARESETDAHMVLRFTVRDTGIGIPKDALQYLFQAFSQVDGSTTRRHGGTGLGLSISKQLVELMGGQIGVESAVGAGSTFWFTVRLEKQPGTTPPATPGVSTLSHARILIADDNEASRQLLLTCAHTLGADAAAAASGHDALRLLEEAAARGHPFSLAILEMEMNDLDGLTLARTIKSNPGLEKTRLILVTPRSPQSDTTLFRASGVSAILAKPVRQRNLTECMSRLLTAAPQHETRFWLNRRTAPREPSVFRLPSASRALRVLVAEDNPINQRVAVALLEKLGCHARAVATGREVLRACEDVAYDVILMDCQLPEMDGFEATRELRRRESASLSGPDPRPPVYVIAMTAFAQPGARDRCLAAGMNDYVSKPVRIETLTEALSRAMAQLPLAPVGAQTSPTSATSATPFTPAAPVTPDGPPALDLSALQALKALRMPQRPDPVAEVIAMFLQEVPQWLRDMERGLTRYEPTPVKSSAHSLKGCASAIGALRLAELSAQLEAQAEKGSLQVARYHLQQVRTEFQRVCHALDAARPSLLEPDTPS